MNDSARYRAAPFHAVRGRQGNRVVTSVASGERRMMADGVFALLDQMRGFRTLAEHAERLARGQAGDVRKALEDLKRQGLLMSEEEFFRASVPRDADACAPISTIGIPTSGRAELVDRCVESCVAHARKYGREVRFVIAGPDRSRAEELVAAMGLAGVDRAVARFALLGEAEGLPRGLARTTGANRNMLLLECAGQAFLSLDDDTVCSMVRSPSVREGLTIHSTGNPLDMWFGPELPSCEPAEVDLLAEAGRPLGPAIRTLGRLSATEFDHSTMEKLCGGHARSRVVQVGLAGDAATDSSEMWLTTAGGARERLVETEPVYRAAMGSRRILAAAPCETVSSSRQLMSYCVALDHRELLPPFPPLARDQDGVFGVWERLVEPDSFTVHVPFAIAHEPMEARAFAAGELRPRMGIGLNEVLYMMCEDAQPSPGRRTAAALMLWLGGMMEDAGSLSPGDFKVFLRERRMRSLSRRIAVLEGALKMFGSRPTWWVQDVQRFLRCWEVEMTGADPLRYTEPGANGVEDAAGIYRDYVKWCGRLLREWSGMREAALRWRDGW